MKIALLSGAYGNSGDSLIEFRGKKLLEYKYNNACVNVFSRKELTNRFDEIDSHDLIVFSGGPIYQRDISGNFDVDTANKLTKPIKILGGGWKGLSRSQQLTLEYKFSCETKKLFKRINDEHGLGCRDWYSVKSLKNNGFSNAVMTGCPAWYDLRFVDDTVIRKTGNKKKVICVSDPAYSANFHMVKPILNHIHNMFPDDKIIYVLHRGRKTANHEEVISSLEDLHFIDIVNMEQSIDSFSVYDDCDLHIGFRVHAHIYCLSLRHRSILIEEDGRGAGVNEALGLPALVAYNDLDYPRADVISRIKRKVIRQQNELHLSLLNEYINIIDTTNDIYYENAFRLMKEFFLKMNNYLESFS